MAQRYFGQGSGAYKCHACGKTTRETGEGESGSELCRACFIYSGDENSHNDNRHEGLMVDCDVCGRPKPPPGYKPSNPYIDSVDYSKPTSPPEGT